MGLAQAAAQEARVLRVGEDRPAPHPARSREHAVAGLGPVADRVAADAGPDQRQRARIEQRLEALERARLLRPLPDSDAAHAALRQSTALCPPNPNELEIATGRVRMPVPLPLPIGRALSGT